MKLFEGDKLTELRVIWQFWIPIILNCKSFSYNILNHKHLIALFSNIISGFQNLIHSFGCVNVNQYNEMMFPQAKPTLQQKNFLQISLMIQVIYIYKE